MPKDKLTDYSATNASNTDVGGVNIDEGMLPSAVNNSIRELMTHLKDFADGTTGIDVLNLQDDDASASIKFQAPAAVTTTVTFTLPDGDGTNGQTLITNGSGTLAWAYPYGNRNLIINGAMQVAQRGTSALTLSGASQYAVDRFHASRDTAGVTATIQQVSTVPNSTFTNSLKVSVTTGASVGASDDGFVRYKVEGYDAARLGFGGSGAEPMTFSFWVRSSLTGTFGVAFGNNAADRGYNATYTISAANTWEHKSITVAGDTSGTWLTTNGNGMFIAFDIGSGSSRSRAASSSWETSYLPGLSSGVKVLETTGADWYITGVQLEVGEQATPFEHRSFGDELRRCQRYYEKSFPQGVTPAQNNGVKGHCLYAGSSDGGSILGFKPYRVEKRASATVVGYNPSAANANFSNGGSPVYNNNDATGFSAYTTTTTGSRALLNWTADAEL